MTDVLDVLFYVWCMWVLFNVASMMWVVVYPLDGAHFNGFRVHVPEWVRSVLTGPELNAVLAHERGHQYEWHVWKNFFSACFCMPMTSRRRMRQELEADDHVPDQLALASALRKLSIGGFDQVRALRATWKHHDTERPTDFWISLGVRARDKLQDRAQDARDPTPGMGEHDRRDHL